MIASLFKSFLYPAFFICLPFPLVVSMFFRPKIYDRPLILPIYNDFKKISYKMFSVAKPPLRINHVLMWLSWLFLIIALARPQRLIEVDDVNLTGRDLMLVVDMSGSMAHLDMISKKGARSTRFAVVKDVVGDFISRRIGDRVGLVIFGGTAHLYAPLTFDVGAVVTMLEELDIGMVEPTTAIGDGIAVGAKALADKKDSKSKVIVLLTDGVNNAGEIKPEDAAKLALTLGIKIYTIGFVGKNSDKDTVDESSLIRIAYGTGAQYYRATNRTQLENIYAEIDKLEPSLSKTDSYVYVDVFYIPLFLSFLCLIGCVGGYVFKK